MKIFPRNIEHDLRCGADPNLIHPSHGISALHLAAGLGLEVTALMIKYGGDPNVQSTEGITPLHVASSWGDKETLHLLLQNGADINIQDQDGKTAYDLAVEEGHEECLRLLKHHAVMQTVRDAGISPRYVVKERWQQLNEEFSGKDLNSVDSNNVTYLSDDSAEEAEILSQKYSDKVTKQMYEYLDKGKPVFFDATSPDTPIIGMKSVKTDGFYSSACTHNMQPSAWPLPCGEEPMQNSSVPGCPLESQAFHNHSSELCLNTQCHCNRMQIPHPQDYQKYGCSDAASPVENKLYSSACYRSHGFGNPHAQHTSSYHQHSGFSSGSCRNHCHGSSSPHGYCCVGNTALCPWSSPCTGLHQLSQPLLRKEELSHNSYTSLCKQELDRSSPSQARVMKNESAISCEDKAITPQESREPLTNRNTDSLKQEYTPSGPPSNDHFIGVMSIFGSPKTSEVRRNTSTAQCSDRNNSHFRVSDVDVSSSKIYFPPLNFETCGEEPLQSSPKHRYPESAQNVKNLTDVFQDILEKTHRSSAKETAVPVPKLLASSQKRVAEFILSGQNFMTKCSLTDSNEHHLSNTEGQTYTNGSTAERKKIKESINREETSYGLGGSQEAQRGSVGSILLDTSGFSEDSFATCCEDDLTAKAGVTFSSHSPQSVITEIRSTKKNEPTNDKREIDRDHTIQTYSADLAAKWKPPTLQLHEDDIMTSDDSFVQKARSPRIYRMKMKSDKNKDINGGCRTFSENKKQVLSSVSKIADTASFTNQVSYQKHPNSSVQVKAVTSKNRLSSDSMLSILSAKEYIYRDKDKGITLIERHIPSDCGSSVGRRSIDSCSSRATIDSQATLIYDWRKLREVLKTSKESCQSSESTICFKETHSSLESDSKLNEHLPNVGVHAHLENLTCQEISQELQKYGEIPGPVIPATRQVYLHRLASLESNPGLVKLSKSSPDYPHELRQALNGQFDISEGADLERQMMEVFSSSTNGRQWREGNVKSSFTYLLLDPRITDNLPMRAKDMSEIEVFKTFICSIFYIGKGKRARPYCHLYEAVSKMSKRNSKISMKVKHIIDIWNTGLGVVSLHCFQSVIPVEAYTREACMIEAIGIHKLTNMKRGDVYGAASTWSMQQRRRMGVYLLKKALQIFLAEGERQICIPDLKSSQ